MTRKEAIAKLAAELENHYPNRSYGCECVRRKLQPQQVRVLGDLEPMLLWPNHIAQISFEYAKGF